VFGPFDVELGLLPFNHPWIDALPARSQWGCCNISQQALEAPRELVSPNHLELGDGIQHHTYSIIQNASDSGCDDEAQTAKFNAFSRNSSHRH
jgi:hypothetical protein